MRAHMYWPATICAVIATVLSGGMSFAQDSRATIIGHITDPSGAVIAGASVRAINIATNAGGSSVSNESGNFEVPYLLSGIYRISVETKGFKTAVRDKIELRVSERVAIDFTLQVGDVAESVTVTGQTPLLQTTNASTGLVVEQRMAQDLPNVGGNSFLFYKFTAGVLNAGKYGGGDPMELNGATQIIVNGTFNMSEAEVDGSPNMGQRNMVFSPPKDLVQEVRIQTAAYDASVGHAAGALTNISTKSGTNDPHGTLYYQDSRWAAVPWFTNNFVYNPTTGPVSSVAKKRMLDTTFFQLFWGGTVTAPVIIPKVYNGKNRTFWSFGYEGLYAEYNNSASYTVPLPAQKQGDFSQLLAGDSRYQIYDPMTTVPAAQNGRFQRQPMSGNIIPKSRLNPIALNILKYYPDPNQAGTSDGRQNYFRTVPNIPWNRTLVNRFDHILSDKQRLFARWNNNQYDSTSDTLPTFVTKSVTSRTGWGAVLDDVYVFNPQLLLNVRYGITYQRLLASRGSQGFDLTTLGFSQNLVNEIASKTNPAGFTFPAVNIDGGAYTQLGADGGSDVKTYYHTFSATTTKVTGGHSIRFGGEYRIMQENGFNYGNVSPQLTFAQAYTRGPLDNSPTAPIGQGLASLLLGIPTGGSVSVNASRAEQSTFSGLFIQDDWRVTRRLTVNLGLRYEYEAPTTERYNRSIRGFDFSAQSPIAVRAIANYAKNPIPELPVSQFQLMGGLTFAGVDGQPRALWNADKNNFAPRIGFAYELNPKTTLRGGYGIFYDVVGVDRQDVNQGGFNQSTSLIPSADNGQTYQATLSNPFPFGIQMPVGAAGGLATYLGRGTSFFDSNPLNPYMQRWSIAVQRELPGRFVLESSYVGNRGTKLAVQRQYSSAPAKYLSTLPYRDQPTIDYLSAQVTNPFYGIPEFAGTGLANQTISRASLLAPYPQFSGITANMPYGYSYFHSLQVGAEKRLSAGLMFQAAWTYSRFMEATGYLNATDLAPEKVVSTYDRPHRLVVTGLYELPFGQGKFFFRTLRGLPQAIVGGWQFQGVYEAQSGQALGFGNAIFNGNLHDIPLPVDQRKVQRWFNTNAGFERDNSKSLSWNIQGLSSRFTGIRGDGINNFNFSMYKHLTVREGMRLRFMVIAGNSMNHAQFDAPNTNPTSSAFGTVTSISGGPARHFVLGLKLLF